MGRMGWIRSVGSAHVRSRWLRLDWFGSKCVGSDQVVFDLSDRVKLGWDQVWSDVIGLGQFGLGQIGSGPTWSQLTRICFTPISLRDHPFKTSAHFHDF